VCCATLPALDLRLRPVTLRLRSANPGSDAQNLIQAMPRRRQRRRGGSGCRRIIPTERVEALGPSWYRPRPILRSPAAIWNAGPTLTVAIVRKDLRRAVCRLPSTSGARARETPQGKSRRAPTAQARSGRDRPTPSNAALLRGILNASGVLPNKVWSRSFLPTDRGAGGRNPTLVCIHGRSAPLDTTITSDAISPDRPGPRRAKVPRDRTHGKPSPESPALCKGGEIPDQHFQCETGLPDEQSRQPSLIPHIVARKAFVRTHGCSFFRSLFTVRPADCQQSAWGRAHQETDTEKTPSCR